MKVLWRFFCFDIFAIVQVQPIPHPPQKISQVSGELFAPLFLRGKIRQFFRQLLKCTKSLSN